VIGASGPRQPTRLSELPRTGPAGPGRVDPLRLFQENLLVHLESCVLRINAWLRGWHQFFGIASPGEQFTLRALDAHIRRRLRAILLHHWKRRPTIVRNLIALGVKRRSAWQGVYQGHRSLWALSHIPQVDRTLRPRYFTDRGLVSLVELHHRAHQEIVAPTHGQLALEWG